MKLGPLGATPSAGNSNNFSKHADHQIQPCQNMHSWAIVGIDHFLGKCQHHVHMINAQMETFLNSWKGEINENAVFKVRVMHFSKNLPPSKNKIKSDIEPQFLLGGRGCERSKLSSIYQNWLQRLYITRFCTIIIVTIEPWKLYDCFVQQGDNLKQRIQLRGALSHDPQKLWDNKCMCHFKLLSLWQLVIQQ